LILKRVGAFEPIPDAGLDLRQHRSYFLHHIGSTSGWIFLSILSYRMGMWRLYSVIFEAHEDGDGEILHFVTRWRSTKEEIRSYEENSQRAL